MKEGLPGVGLRLFGVGSTRRKKPAPRSGLFVYELCRRSPNLPHTYACSTIGPTRLNFRVRDGNGWDPRSKLTGKLSNDRANDPSQLNRLSRHCYLAYRYKSSITTKLVLNVLRAAIHCCAE